jgi:alpha-L-rhamnosidase
MKLRNALLLLLFPLSLIAQKSNTSIFKIAEMKCNYKLNPLGVETLNPRFSWTIEASDNNQRQTAYRVLVADSPEVLAKNQGNVWDSGKTMSEKSNQIEFGTVQNRNPTSEIRNILRGGKKYFWKVMVWDANGKPSAWSDNALWQMGLLSPQEWGKSEWLALEKIIDSNKILPALHNEKAPKRPTNALPQFRKTFTVANGKTLKNATAFVSGLGHFELFLNGEKVSKNFLDAGWTKYEKYAQYVTFDIKNQVKQGKNAVGVMLGNGFYNIPQGRYWKILQSFGYPTFIAKIQLEYTDGTVEDIVSDTSWKTIASPIRFTSIFGGEDYNANLEEIGWKNADFDDNHWQTPLVLTNMPPVVSQQQEPLGYFDSFGSVKITEPKPNVFVYDLGQNMSGIPYIAVQGKRGDTVRISPSELLNDKGTIAQWAVGAPVFFNYILNGKGIEKWQPQFTYYGFRFIQIEGAVPEGYPNPNNLPVVKDIKGIHTRNAAEAVGTFTCSNPLFNNIHKLIDWSIKSNLASVITDCPHREKLGWLEQSYLMGNSIRYNYDLATLAPKVMADMQASQTTNGMVPDIAPEYVYFGGGFRDSPEWGSAAIILPWEMYQWYGDRNLLTDNYLMMKKYVDYLSSRAKNHIVTHGLGDWFDLGPKQPGESQLTSTGVTATSIYYYDITLLSKIARLLGKEDDAKTYENLGKEVRKAFNATYFNAEKMSYDRSSQTAFSMAIVLGLVEAENKNKVFQSLLTEIKNSNYALTAGDVGFHYLVSVLQNEGASDVIFKMNSRSDVPGYGFQIAKGATALTESWPALKNVSNNHLMLGHLMEWFYNGLAGIKQTDNSVGFKEIMIRPEPVGDITEVTGSYKSIYGLVKSQWKKTDKTFSLSVEIPVNTTAFVYLPSNKNAQVTVNKKPVKSMKNVQFIKNEGDKMVFKVGSGKYDFMSN